MWLEINHLTYIPASISNLNIQFMEANDKQNKRWYDILVYTLEGKLKLYTVVWYNGHWHECYSKPRTHRPFLGPIRMEVHATNIAEESQPDESNREDSTTKDEKEPDTYIQNTLATIVISSPESTHWED